MATFVFLPPYLLATALFAHGANVTDGGVPAQHGADDSGGALAQRGCSAWAPGCSANRCCCIFGGDYARHSWAILALLVPAGLWMVFKDHLVALWRSQRRFALATRLAGAALVLEIAGAIDRWDHRRSPRSLHRVVDRDGSGNDAGHSVAAPGLRWPALALAAARASPHRSDGGATVQVVVGAALVVVIGGRCARARHPWRA